MAYTGCQLDVAAVSGESSKWSLYESIDKS